MIERRSRLVYIYAEYCPGDLFWGWWLYACPIRFGLPDRNNRSMRNGTIWMNKFDWMIEMLMSRLGLKCEPAPNTFYKRHSDRSAAEEFMRAHPNGIVMRLANEYDLELIDEEEQRNHDLAMFSRRVRELQLRDWKHGDEDFRSRIARDANEHNKYELMKLEGADHDQGL